MLGLRRIGQPETQQQYRTPRIFGMDTIGGSLDRCKTCIEVTIRSSGLVY